MKFVTWYGGTDEEMSDFNGEFVWATSEEVYDLIGSQDILKGFRYGLGINYHCFGDLEPWETVSLVNYKSSGYLSVISAGRGIGWWGSWKGLINKYTK